MLQVAGWVELSRLRVQGLEQAIRYAKYVRTVGLHVNSQAAQNLASKNLFSKQMRSGALLVFNVAHVLVLRGGVVE